MLQRHQSLDVRGLLEQDLLLLRDLCLSSAAVISRHGSVDGSGCRDGAGDEGEISGGAVVARCWRLHVGLLLHVLRKIPEAADDSLAVVEHVALPCLEALAAVCLDGTSYPPFEAAASSTDEDDGSGDGEDKGPGPTTTSEMAAARGRVGDAAAVVAGAAKRQPNCRLLGDALLREVLRASANAWGTADGETAGSTGRGGGGGGGGAVWRTPLQIRNERLVRRTWQGLIHAIPTVGGSATLGGARSPPALVMANSLGGIRVPEHWLLRLLVNRRSAVLRKFSGLVLGTLATSMGAELSEEMAEAAAHLMGCVAMDGSESAALQVGCVLFLLLLLEWHLE